MGTGPNSHTHTRTHGKTCGYTRTCDVHYYCLYGTTSNPCAQSTFGQCKLTQVDLAFIQDMIAQRHSVYLDEIQEELLAHRGVLVSIPTLG